MKWNIYDASGVWLGTVEAVNADAAIVVARTVYHMPTAEDALEHEDNPRGHRG